ncbi:diguanylate cyclase/phosphodiesterase with extracellular sensor [Enterobacter hormaechei]|uniref:biofilm formation regulator HmsP n=1 Tax=Enterobacter hormaechei TaxID=158836 RepID=UPI00123C6123|nr:biofilm formation regulator HmsP [Enterobacter hormaechei]HAT7663565.1 biofilm formation regulator HmsP [Enterobacter hormaechei subsp. steigerwaltii]QEU13620.1 biofilm formation regulator HmsP [Enterobacter hormaechei]VAM33652.1 diguanylate cyclase/phosphodiesterase with extracellular sensor [Enterobacter hormaechei]VAM41441.1 diguanylate cyclase/phosphodiesterase with extracellular sensor [Enterobacter hormaechei]HAV1630734.1 biofilm formation regulator HmsP [Enterobacter hormaechei subsp
MRVSRSLTIKQMAMVSAVTMLFVFIFCVILLFHSVQQNRYNTASQLESIARSVREPLSASILKGDIPEAESILKRIQPAGIVSRADVVLPNQFQALRMSFIPERPVPMMVMRLFELPVQISLPLYSLERPANPQPLAYLVLQADSYRMYKFVMSWVATLVTTYLLLTLMLSVALTWCINRLIVHPLRRIARELNDLSPQEHMGHQLPLPRLHHDDEIGMLVRSYNINQQRVLRQQEELSSNATRFPVSDLPNKAFLMALLEQTVARQQTTALMVIACETLQDTAGVLKESQREMLLLTLVEKVKSVLAPRMVLTQVSGYDLVVIAHGVKEPWHAITLGQQVLTVINERLPIQGIQLRPSASIGIAMYNGGLTAEQLYRRAFSAAFTARRKGKNQIQFFDPEQMEKAQQRLTEESDILTAMDNRQFALWLQPQVNLRTSEVTSAEALLRMQQPDGTWELPEGMIERIESCGLMVTVGYWVLEESCRQLAAWQQRGITLPLSVNLSALQLMHPTMVPEMLELIHRYRIQPHTLILEVTESRCIDNPDDAVAILKPLRNAGIRIALDDFGMGYSGLRQLQHMKTLPVDVLKIDKTFVEGLPEDCSLVQAIIQMAHSLNLHVIAEGIETDAQREWLAAAGVESGQGFLFDRAAPTDIFEKRYLADAGNNAKV